MPRIKKQQTVAQMRKQRAEIRAAAMVAESPDDWRPKIGDVVFVPARVDEQVAEKSEISGFTEYVWKDFPTLSPGALLGIVVANTQANDLVKIRDVSNAILSATWKVKKVKERFILISSLRPFRDWDAAKALLVKPVATEAVVSIPVALAK